MASKCKLKMKRNLYFLTLVNNKLMAKSIVTFLLLFTAAGSFGQNAVTIPIATKDNAMVLQTDKDGRLNIVYSGKKLVNADEYSIVAKQYNMNDVNAVISNNAYTPAGSWSLVEPALQVTHGWQ
jgi:alpha-galactosidase